MDRNGKNVSLTAAWYRGTQQFRPVVQGKARATGQPSKVACFELPVRGPGRADLILTGKTLQLSYREKDLDMNLFNFRFGTLFREFFYKERLKNGC